MKLIKQMLFAVVLFNYAGQMVYAKEASPYQLPPDYLSVSHGNGVLASLSNPALGKFLGAPILGYRFVDYDEGSSNHYLYSRLLGLDFVYGYYGVPRGNEDITTKTGAHYYSFGSSIQFIQMLGFGFSYAVSSSASDQLDNLSAWKLGLLVRPHRFVSIGYSVHDLGSIGDSALRSYDLYSLALRPGTDRITLSSDAKRHHDEGFADIRWSFATEMEVGYGITAFARGDLDMNIRAGITVPFYSRSIQSINTSLDLQRSFHEESASRFTSFGVMYSAERRPGSVAVPGQSQYLLVKIDRPISEKGRHQFLGRDEPAFIQYLQAIERSAEDSSIHGILLQIDNAAISFSQAEELRNALIEFRKSGKKVHAILTSMGNVEYYLSTAADTITTVPGNVFMITGLRAQVYYLKGLLNKVGVEFERIRAGEYKSAYEELALEEMSPEHRENLTQYLSDMNNLYITSVLKARNISREKIEEAMNGGPMTPEEAVQHRFIDRIGYPSDLMDELDEDGKSIPVRHYMKERDYHTTWGPRPVVAVMYLEGNIVRGPGGDSILGSGVGDESYRSMIRKVFRDPSVAAVVIRINSGGGSASASDLMWKSLVEAKEKYDKPVVLSFGSIAASGGYYVACTGDTVVAGNSTLTGSIGVISGKLNLQQLYQKLGINKEVVTYGEFADLFSESRPLSAQERRMLQKGVDYSYTLFTSRVMTGRDIGDDRIDELAQGRIFSGVRARKEGLVDRNGGILTAVSLAAEKAEIPENRYQVKLFRQESLSLEELVYLPEMKELRNYLRKTARYVPSLSLAEEEYLYMVPWYIEIR